MALELVDLTKEYPGGAIGARDVNLIVEPGDYVALFGPSGSGKTSLLHMAGLLLHPDSGEVHLDGERVDGLSEGAAARVRRTKLGFVFQIDRVDVDADAIGRCRIHSNVPGRSIGPNRPMPGESTAFPVNRPSPLPKINDLDCPILVKNPVDVACQWSILRLHMAK